MSDKTQEKKWWFLSVEFNQEPAFTILGTFADAYKVQRDLMFRYPEKKVMLFEGKLIGEGTCHLPGEEKND